MPTKRVVRRLVPRHRQSIRRFRAIDSHTPVRTCIGCRRRRLQSELVRITRTSGDNEPTRLSIDGPSHGRGAWLCRDDEANDVRVAVGCLERALSQQQFARAWRTKLRPHDVEAIRAALRHDEEHTG